MANVIDILVTRQAQKELEKIVENLKKAHDEIVRINQTGLNINGTTSPRNPTDLNNLIRQNEELARKYRELEERLSRLNAQRQVSRQRTSEEIVNQRELAQNADRQTRATSALVGAYNNLNAQHQIASRRLQDLIARGRTANQTQSQYNREIREAQTAFQGLDRRIQSADRAVGRFNRNVGNYRQAFSGLRDLIGAFGIAGGVTLFAGIATSIFQTTKELQSLDNALKQVSGTQEQMARSQAFLRDVSEAYGLEINGLTKQFTQFYVSAKDKLSGTQIENIFRSISKAGATMGLSVENQERAFLALNQMMSKGVVSAEELRGQLGEALPGAFGIMAKAVGVTEQELGKLMKDGKLLADEVLPKFARELEKVYGIETINRVETLTASQNRLKNSWTELVRSLNESETGGISQFFKFIVHGLNKIANLLIRVNTSWNDLYKQAGAKGEKAGKKFFEENIRLNSSDVELSAKERASIKKRIDEIKSLIASGYNDPKFQKELNELNRKLNPSTGQAESLGITADKNIDKYTDKIEKLNEQLKKTEEQQSTFLKRTFNPNFGKSEKDLKKEIERANFDLAYWKQVKESADNYGNAIEENGEKEINLNKELKKDKKEKIALSFKEVESEYILKKSILERQRAERNDRATDEGLNFDLRLTARKEFSEKSIEILELEMEKEKAIFNLKMAEDLNKNNVAFRNKELSYSQYTENIKHINKRHYNEIENVDINYSLKWNDLLNSDADFYKKIQDDKKKYTEDTNKLILDSETEKFKKISEDEKKSLLTRNLAHAKYIDLAKQQLQVDKIIEMSKATSQEQLDNIIIKYDLLSKSLDNLSTPYKKARESFEDYLESISSGKMKEKLEEIGVSSLKMFLDIDKNGQNSFMKMLEVAETTGEKIAVVFQTVGDVFQDVANLMSEASQKRFDAEYSRLEMQKNISIQFAGESATAREEIERQYEERKRAIARREAEAQKRLAIFNIAIDTAQAVVAALPKIPLSIAMGALGAAQIAMVSSQSIPEFWKGTDNAPEGLAWTQEKGAEVITDKKGNVKTLGNNKGAQLTYLEKGDKVYKSQQDYINKTLVGAGIQPMRENNSLTSSDFNAGISKLAKTMQSNKGSDTQVFLNNKRIDTDYFKGKNV